MHFVQSGLIIIRPIRKWIDAALAKAKKIIVDAVE
jgi:hypothetical protein